MRESNVIVEYIRYQIPAAEQTAFEEAYIAAEGPLRTSPHCLGWELARCAEDPTQYVLRIEWDSAEGHLQGFRTSPEFRDFFTAVRPFVDNIQEMRHYEVTTVHGTKGDG